MIKRGLNKNIYGERIDRKDLAIKTGIIIAIKGFLMGVCDVIPGVSGGTIAFITGIYIRLITAIKELNFTNALELLKLLFSFHFKKVHKKIRSMDMYFLLILFIGIIFAIMITSRVVGFFLDNYLIYTLAFFSGLVLMSSKIIFDVISIHNKKNYLFGFLGFVIGLSMLFFRENSISTPSYLYIFFSGFIAISALFLPGISGSFILLVMGVYEFMIDSLHDIVSNILYILMFILGAVGGMFFISRLITYLYKKDKSKTLYVLLGLVLGSLFVPLKQIFNEIYISDLAIGQFVIVAVFTLSFFLAGMLSVFLIERFSREPKN